MDFSMLPPKTAEQAKTDIIQSIALMENGIASILNAQGEELQSISDLKTPSVQELLKLNKSIEDTVTSLTILESLLQKKLALVTEKS